MNLCIFSIQTVLLTVLVVQYHYINEVDAESQNVGNWYNSVERKFEAVQGKIVNAVRNFVSLITGHDVKGDRNRTVNKHFKKTVNISNFTNTQERKLKKQVFKEQIAAGHDVSDVSHEVRSTRGKMVDEKLKPAIIKEEPDGKTKSHKDTTKKETKNVAEPEVTKQEVKEKKAAPKRRKRIIKKYRRRVNKPDHLHVPHEPRLDESDQQDKADFPRKVVKRIHKKSEKERGSQRKFVKTLPKESNSSESDEVKRRKPVDIIVHIKMND